MGKCFVIQPFDGDKFDRRFDEVFAPSIKKADLEPYRVDRDPSVSVPIEDIEKGIQASDICFAEISTDNPNVWFELGYAIAAQKEVVLVCSDERQSKFPFDVQHRSIIKYKTASPSDFDNLRDAITVRLKALLSKEKQIAHVASSSPLAETEGLTSHEMVALVTVMQNQFSPDASVPAYRVVEDMNKAGFTDIATSLGLRGLTRKEFLLPDTDSDINGNDYSVYRVTQKGEDWLFKNQDRLTLRTKGPSDVGQPEKDELPF